jgi:hypothetical protein
MGACCLTPGEQFVSFIFCCLMCILILPLTNIGGLMVIVIASSAVDRVFEPLSVQTKECSSCSTSGTHRVSLGTNPDMNQKSQLVQLMDIVI